MQQQYFDKKIIALSKFIKSHENILFYFQVNFFETQILSLQNNGDLSLWRIKPDSGID